MAFEDRVFIDSSPVLSKKKKKKGFFFTASKTKDEHALGFHGHFPRRPLTPRGFGLANLD
jgi:hypothetical protein